MIIIYEKGFKRAKRMHLPFLLLVLVLSTVNALTLNECGGLNALSLKLGALCDASEVSECSFGRTAYHGNDAVMCNPDCSITPQQVLQLTKTPPCPHPRSQSGVEDNCLNGGKYDPVEAKCVCPHLYSGVYCETEDPCINTNCGLHGHCANGVCVCDTFFSGVRCEIKSDCEPPNFRWTGTECKCQRGYEGDKCDRCVADLICVPANAEGTRYYPLVLSLEEDFFELPPPPPYTTRPYVPTTGQLCACGTDPKIGSRSSLFDDDDDDGDDGDYFHSHYHTHYSRSDRCYESDSLAVIVVIIVFVSLLVFALYRCVTPRNDVLPRTRQPQARSPVVRPRYDFREVEMQAQ